MAAGDDGTEEVTAERGQQGEAVVTLGSASLLSYAARGGAEAAGVRRAKGCTGPSGGQESRVQSTPTLEAACGRLPAP